MTIFIDEKYWRLLQILQKIYAYVKVLSLQRIFWRHLRKR